VFHLSADGGESGAAATFTFPRDACLKKHLTQTPESNFLSSHRIPFFWLFRAIPEVPSAYKAARETWKREASIRCLFWLSIASLPVNVGSCHLPA